MMQPILIIVRGPLGVGKTTVSKALAKKVKGKYISVDKYVDSLPVERARDGFRSARMFLRANARMLPEIKKILNAKSVVVDGNFYRKAQLQHLIRNVNTASKVFTLKAPVSVCILRDKKRKKSLGKDAAQVVYQITSKFDAGICIPTQGKTPPQTLRSILSHF